MNQAPPPQAKSKLPLWLIGLASCGCLVLVLLVVAAIAFPAFVTYIKRSKSIEAEANVSLLVRLVEERCRDGQSFDGLAAGPLPAVPSDVATLPAWSMDPGFATLGFAPASPTYYSYEVGFLGGLLTITARGDLDADGVQSQFQSGCDLASCRCQPMTTHQELE